MKLLSSLNRDIDQQMLPGLRKRMTADNIRRGRILAVSSIVGISIFAVINIGALLLHMSEQYAFFSYLIVYITLVLINAAFLLLTRKLKTIDHLGESVIKTINRFILAYVILSMTWGSLISVLTQPIYGQLTMCMVGMMVCCIIFLYDDKEILFALVFPIATLCIGLPFFQPSRYILMGNYSNLLFFLAACYMVSRLAFRKYCSDYVGSALLESANSMLERQVRQNELMTRQLEQANGRLRMLSQYDELTGASNRRNFRDYIGSVLNTTQENVSLSIIMIDIDHFKEYNDHCGHSAGDKLLVQIAHQIRNEIRRSEDAFVRWGGDEFLFASFSADESEAAEIAERIRLRILTLSGIVLPTKGKSITVSCGICCMHIRSKEDVDCCIERADQALYIAKSSGRNCVRVAPLEETA